MLLFASHKTRSARPRRPRLIRFRPCLEALEDRCLLSAGALDPTFNPTGSPPGVVTTSFGGHAQANAVVIQLDGKFVAAGDNAELARYNHDGSLDTSFNGTGKALLPFGPYTDGLALQSDGKIVVGGTYSGDFALARLTTSGTRDSTFGTQGIVSTAFSGKGKNAPGGQGLAVGIQADGKIVLAGETSLDGTHSDIGIVRWNSDGSLDTTFGSGGKVVTSHALAAGVDGAAAQNLVLDSAGRLIVTGYAHLLSPAGYYEPFVARYNPTGSLDTSLGGSGILPLTQFQAHLSAGTQEAWAALQTDGKTVLTWYTDVIRLNADGSLDTASFGPLSGGTHTGYEALPPNVGAGAVQLQGDGKIVVATVSTLTTSGFGATRLLNDGSLDPSFGTGGTSILSSGYSAHALAIQPADGCIVVAGGLSGTYFVVARFLPAEPQISSFTASPNPVTAGSSVTLTAGNIQDANPKATITQVAFYVDSNGDGRLEPANDTLLGYATQTSPGVWTFTFTVQLAPGPYTLFAQAQDSYGVFGDPLALTLQVL